MRWFWILPAACLMLVFIGDPPVQRTQEARVLETARQMLGRGWQDWMIPHLNGSVRLQKPPLAYWMAAAGFSVGGVNDTAGRVPFALCGVATLVVTAWIARKLFDTSAAFYGVAMMLGSYLFFRYMRLAETDAPAALFVTLSIAAIIAGATSPKPLKSIAFQHLAAVGMALASLAKGPPIFFPVIFLLFASLALRSNLIWRFVRSGAPLTLLILVLPWYAYVIQTHGMATFLKELRNNQGGGDHGGSVFMYVPWLAMGVLPWIVFCLLTLVGLIQILRRQTASHELKLLIAWLLAIALPLCMTGNKQVHYLLPLMPPLMILAGWWVALAVDNGKGPLGQVGRIALCVTAGLIVLAGIVAAVLLQRHPEGDGITRIVLPAIVTIGAAASLVLQRQSFYRGMLLLIVTFCLVMPLAVGYAAPHLMAQDPRRVARTIRERFGHSPLVFYGPNLSLPLCYNLRQTIESAASPDELLAMQAKDKNLVVIAQEKSGRTPPVPPAPFERAGEPITSDDQVFTFYRVP